jgi:hypothetical protein
LDINEAIELISTRTNKPRDHAFTRILARIGAGELDATGIDDADERVAIFPHWARWVARFTESPLPEQGIFYFDTIRAAEEWRERRRRLERRDVDPTRWPLPPQRLRDVEVNAAQINRLWPPSAQRRRPTDAELDMWMAEKVTPSVKRDPTLIECREQTGATYRKALAAWGRVLPQKKRGRGSKDRYQVKSDTSNRT